MYLCGKKNPLVFFVQLLHSKDGYTVQQNFINLETSELLKKVRKIEIKTKGLRIKYFLENIKPPLKVVVCLLVKLEITIMEMMLEI